MTKEQVLKIKDIIEEDQKKEIQLTTKIDAEYEKAEKKFGCKSFDDIEDLIEEKEKHLGDLKAKIEAKTKELDEAYSWDV